MKITTIPTNPENDYLMGRNGMSKLKAIQVWDSGGMVFIDGINTKGAAVSNSGFRFGGTAAVLRQLAQAFATLADEAEGKVQEALQSALAARECLADAAFEAYCFGESVSVEAHDSWNTSDPLDFTKIVYVKFDDDAPAEDSRRVSFHVRFTTDGKVDDVYALEMEHGNEIGTPGSSAAKAAATTDESLTPKGPHNECIQRSRARAEENTVAAGGRRLPRRPDCPDSHR